VINKKYFFIIILIFFVLILPISSVNACLILEEPGTKVDNGSVKFKDSNNAYLMKWNTYWNSEKNQRVIYKDYYTYDKVDKKYNLVSESNTTFKKITKNKLKIVSWSETELKPKIYYKKTKLTTKDYYGKIFKPKMIKNYLSKNDDLNSKYTIIDNEKKEFNNTKTILKTFHNKKTVIVKYDYDNKNATLYDPNLGFITFTDRFTGSLTYLTKINKTKIQVIEYIYTAIPAPGSSPKKSVKYYDTNLSAKLYYFKYYKPKLISYNN
jgi:hypothetical protein